MTRLGILVTGVAVGLFGLACQRDDQSVAEKLEQIDKRLASIESKLGQGGGARAGAAAGRRAPQQRPKGPDPQAVYSVDVTGNQFEGVKDAKVTVVEAFEFA